jgi:hypothetical protein
VGAAAQRSPTKSCGTCRKGIAALTGHALHAVLMPARPCPLPSRAPSCKLQAEATAFRPRINTRSAQLAARRQEREAEGGVPLNGNSSAATAAGSSGSHGREAAAPSFQPAIDPGSRRLLEESERIPADFLARAEFFRRQHQQQREELRQATEVGVLRRVHALLALELRAPHARPGFAGQHGCRMTVEEGMKLCGRGPGAAGRWELHLLPGYWSGNAGPGALLPRRPAL